jgi:hypothetical protein
MDIKRLRRIEVKDASKGEVTAVFATLNVVDHDKDVTLPGAFKSGSDVVISAYGHQSWDGKLPVGSGTIEETSSEALLHGKFFMDTTQGRDTFTTVKNLAAQGLGEWSYGYEILEADHGTFEGQDVQFLKSLHVAEVSPVLVAAGIGTRTTGVKSGTQSNDSKIDTDPYASAIKPHETKTVDREWSHVEAYTAVVDGDIKSLREMFGWVNSTGDPEAKSSYGVLHHHADGSANLRACMLAIAEMSLGKSVVPQRDQRSVWNHVASHLAAGDIEPPEIGSLNDGGMKFFSEAVLVMAALSSLNVRASDVVAMRAVKGKAMASQSALLLEWCLDEVKSLRRVLDTPNEDAARELLRFIRDARKDI